MYPQAPIDLMIDGPIVEVKVMYPQRPDWQPEKAFNVKKEITCNALIDTGSAYTIISSHIIKEMELKANGFVQLKTITGNEDKHQTFFTRICLPGINFYSDVRVVGGNATSDYDVIIGRNLMIKWQSFTYNGKKGTFTINL